ncbi:ParB N-terminal domain-containing protein [Paraburkholderia sp. BL21I4N1]|uniref:ParB N-terminal domain-containing protein n=1 Tax=Paraburkholderia sp. BL21I4N1 TaxID=1938801 RepID=UPI000CFD4D22|nr:ParB N-terminal domain-containing protein [Paraburkholderia sp. BL21I4N1]PQV44157.1 ParB family protein of integrating conjugative element (PFGI_1 class) [Paraburkholderia sp. BL21I4N1]
MNRLTQVDPGHDGQAGEPGGGPVGLAMQRLGVESPGPRTAEVALVSTIRLKVIEVVTYERNPRRASPDRIAELKESIRVNGIEQIVTVTRRPSETRYVVAKGGNSRLTAAHLLYAETQDPQFLHRDFLYIPYPGEAKLLAAHLRENEQRADLCFWDKAAGYLALKADLEHERGGALSLREFARLLAQDGAPVSHVLLSLFQFATQRLVGLGPATALLSRRNVVDVIQPAVGALTRLVRRFGRDDDWLQHEVIDVALGQFSLVLNPTPESGLAQERVLDAAALVAGMQRRCAEVLDVPLAAIRPMLALVAGEPEISPERLREAAAGTLGATGLVTRKTRSSGEGTPPIAALPPEQTAQPRSDSHIRHPLPASNLPQHTDPLPEASGPHGTDVPDGDAADESAVVDPGGTPAVDRSSDDLANLHQDIRSFAVLCGLESTLRDAPDLPYGFMVDLPDPAQTDPPLDTQARQHEAGFRHYVGWWWLVNLSRQNTPCGLTHLPAGTRFGEITGGEEPWAHACDTHIGEPLLADRFDLFFDTALNPASEIGGRYLELVRIARGFRARHPDRFQPPQWTELDADELLRRGERR